MYANVDFSYFYVYVQYTQLNTVLLLCVCVCVCVCVQTNNQSITVYSSAQKIKQHIQTTYKTTKAAKCSKNNNRIKQVYV